MRSKEILHGNHFAKWRLPIGHAYYFDRLLAIQLLLIEINSHFDKNLTVSNYKRKLKSLSVYVCILSQYIKLILAIISHHTFYLDVIIIQPLTHFVSLQNQVYKRLLDSNEAEYA